MLDKKPKAKEELRHFLSVLSVYQHCTTSQPDFFSDCLFFQFNFRKFLSGLKEWGLTCNANT